MAAQNINRVIITGNLTRDPETRALGGSGATVTSLRVAVNGRRKNNSTGQWEDKPNYFDVTVWGAAGENAQRYLSKGRGVAIDGRLDWREWQDQAGNKRQSVEVIADNVQFLSDGQQGGGGGQQGAYQQRSEGGGYGGGEPQRGAAYESREPVAAGAGYERAAAPAPAGGDDYGESGGYQRGGRETPVDRSDFAPAPARGGPSLPDPGEDDIPF